MAAPAAGYGEKELRAFRRHLRVGWRLDAFDPKAGGGRFLLAEVADIKYRSDSGEGRGRCESKVKEPSAESKAGKDTSRQSKEAQQLWIHYVGW